MATPHLILGDIRYNWTREEVETLFKMPLLDLIYEAQTVHRQHFKTNRIQTSTLLSIKTGACPEDCAYCPQSARYDTGLSREQLMAIDEVVEKAKAAKASGASRFCMGAAWRSPREKDFRVVLEMVKSVKELELETCVTLGMLTEQQTQELKQAGLDYYNHNLDTSESYYKKIISTRTYQDRLDTLGFVRDAGINVCAGGIIGMGEEEQDRWDLLLTLANLPQHPQSVPINQLVSVAGTPMAEIEELEAFEFIRTIAVTRIMMPRSYVRLSAGRETMNEQTQAMCFMAGANSIFYGEQLLTTPNPGADRDSQLLEKLSFEIESVAGDSLISEEPESRSKSFVDETSLYSNAAVH